MIFSFRGVDSVPLTVGNQIITDAEKKKETARRRRGGKRGRQKQLGKQRNKWRTTEPLAGLVCTGSKKQKAEDSG